MATVTEATTIRKLLDGEHAETRDLVREWIARPEHRPPYDIPRAEHRELVLGWIKEVAAAGFPAIGFPAEYGGEANPGRMVAGFETLGMGDLSLLVKVGVQFGLFGGAILHLGTRRHHEAYLRDAVTMALPGCFAMTESGHGSNVQQVRTTATYDPATEEFVIETPDRAAWKDYIGNAAEHGRMAAVFAQLIVGDEARGVHALLVPIRDDRGRPLPGVTLEDCGPKLGLEGVDNGRIAFSGVRVERDALLDRYAHVSEEGVYTSPIENPMARFFTMLGTLVQGRVCISGAAINASKVALTIAVRYGLERRQFGPPDGDEVPLMEYRTHQRRLLPALAATYGLHFAQERLVAQFNTVFLSPKYGELERERRELETHAAGLKAVATWHATATIQACREACGGAGYLRVNRFAALKADTDVFTTFEGDNTVLLQLVSKNLLTDYRDQFGELDPLGLVTFYAGQAAETVAERTAVREVLGRLADDLLPGRDPEEDLLEGDAQLGLMRWRQEHILSGVARRLNAGMGGDDDPFDVLVQCQDHMIAAARAWVDLLVIEAYADAVERCEEGPARELLGKLRSLYALSSIEAERGWYQEHGRLSSTRAKAVTRGVNQLCGELKDSAALLVEALGVPEALQGELSAS